MKANILFFFALCMLFPLFYTQAQNKVPNGGFEFSEPGIRCPLWIYQLQGGWTKLGEEDWITDFSSGREHSTNYVNTCFDKSNEPYVATGALRYEPLYAPSLFQIQLTHPLEADKEYILSVYIKIASRYEEVPLTWNNFGVFFSDKDYSPEAEYNSLKGKTDKGVFAYEHYITDAKTIQDYMSWTQVADTFIATGTEKYLLLGSYIKGFNLAILVDEVSVTAYDKFAPENITAGSKIELRNIHFEIGTANLLDASVAELNKLLELMQELPDLKIEVAGHTDNTGNAQSNITLSEARAQSVANYLIKKGIDESRVQYKGYGDTRPVANNDTENGRKQNRRVEIIVVEN